MSSQASQPAAQAGLRASVVCPRCQEEVPLAGRSPWRYSAASYLLFLLAGAVGLALFLGSVEHKWLLFVMSGAAMGVGYAGYRIPRRRVLDCRRCTTRTVQHYAPPRSDDE